MASSAGEFDTPPAGLPKSGRLAQLQEAEMNEGEHRDRRYVSALNTRAGAQTSRTRAGSRSGVPGFQSDGLRGRSTVGKNKADRRRRRRARHAMSLLYQGPYQGSASARRK